MLIRIRTSLNAVHSCMCILIRGSWNTFKSKVSNSIMMNKSYDHAGVPFAACTALSIMYQYMALLHMTVHVPTPAVDNSSLSAACIENKAVVAYTIVPSSSSTCGHKQ
eukprot:scpid21272/ scgid23093/ 